MRIAMKRVYNKATGQRVFTSSWHRECEEFIAKQSNPEEFVICYKWMSL